MYLHCIARTLPASGRRGFTALATVLALLAVLASGGSAWGQASRWSYEWPKTDFSNSAIEFDEIFSGGPPKDGIPSIDDPKFAPVGEIDDIGEMEPLIRITIAGKTRGYPLRILMWHEIVNDTLGDVPITVTYCPLCNSSIVFDRRVDARVLDFGTTGKLRNSDLVMYDRQTESWWQQFLGEAIVGEMTGTRLKMLPSRVLPFGKFKAAYPEAEVQVPTNPGMRNYGTNPYAFYDSAERPFLYRGPMPEGVEPMMRVVVVDDEAWGLPFLREKGTIVSGGLTLSWEMGMNSALDRQEIARGRDVGSVSVTRKEQGGEHDVVHDVTFAFVFHAFHPEGTLHTR